MKKITKKSINILLNYILYDKMFIYDRRYAMRRTVLLIMFLFVIFPCVAFADSVELSCPNEVAVNSDFVCEITGDTSSGVVAVRSIVSVSDDLKVLNFVMKEGFTNEHYRCQNSQDHKGRKHEGCCLRNFG